MIITSALAKVSRDRLHHDTFYLCRNPLPFRKVNFTVQGHDKNSLDETDDFLHEQLEIVGLAVIRTPYPVQAFRCDSSKLLHQWYSPPQPDDPRYTACNVEVEIPGSKIPGEIIQLVSHKDSMSWIDSPGAHDNAVGTVANLEIARVLAGMKLRRTVRILFCNEEHTPWTSHFAAEMASARGDNIIAVLNLDGLDGKSDEDMAAGRLMHTVGYSTDEGKPLAELMTRLNDKYGIGLEVQLVFKEHVNDDDGMFIKSGYRRTIINIGSFPFADSEYHLVGDRAERVNYENLKCSTQLVLATVLELDQRAENDPWK